MAEPANIIKKNNTFLLCSILIHFFEHLTYNYMYVLLFRCALFMKRNLRSLGVLVGILAHGPTYQIHDSIQLQQIKHLNQDMQQNHLKFEILPEQLFKAFIEMRYLQYIS